MRIDPQVHGTFSCKRISRPTHASRSPSTSCFRRSIRDEPRERYQSREESPTLPHPALTLHPRHTTHAFSVWIKGEVLYPKRVGLTRRHLYAPSLHPNYHRPPPTAQTRRNRKTEEGSCVDHTSFICSATWSEGGRRGRSSGTKNLRVLL